MKAEDFDRLKNKVLTIVTESGEMKDFDADKWLIGWLSKPIGSLGGKRPIDFMETDEGVECYRRSIFDQISRLMPTSD